MTNITSYSLEEIKAELQKQPKYQQTVNDDIRMLFAPCHIDADNIEEVCRLYSRLNLARYKTAVVVEVHTSVLNKKLPMASNTFFETPLGKVPADDHMRNEFCDEDDDFFIHDEGFSRQMGLFHQLMLLQTHQEKFQALSVQIADESPDIIKELVHVLQSVLETRDALLIFCCDLDKKKTAAFAEIKKMIAEKDRSHLLNFMNRGESNIKGAAAFVAGVMIAREWNLKLHFLADAAEDKSTDRKSVV